VKQFGLNYHWSLDQVEFATDIVFQRQSFLSTFEVPPTWCGLLAWVLR
jgi:hypothetical protein